jgi:hypothetical protein
MPVNSESEGKGRSTTILRNYFDSSLEVWLTVPVFSKVQHFPNVEQEF